MNKGMVDKFEIGTPEYVVAHAAWQKARGRGPSESYKGITNPQQALALARKEMPKRPVPDKPNLHQSFRVIKADPFQDERRPKPVAPIQPSLDVRAADNMRIEKALIAVFKAAVANSNGRLVIICGVKGGSDLHLMSADDFLELDGKRLGRNFNVYEFFSEVSGWGFLLTSILNEMILPLKDPPSRELRCGSTTTVQARRNRISGGAAACLARSVLEHLYCGACRRNLTGPFF